MTNDDDAIAEARAYCQPILETVENLLLTTYIAARKSGHDAGARLQRSAIEELLAKCGGAQPAADGKPPKPRAAKKAPPPQLPDPADGDGASPISVSVNKAGGASARTFAYDIVRAAHPQPVPSVTILNALRARDGGEKSLRRDDLFYKSIRRLREDRKIVLTDDGYVLPEGAAVE